jgi:hypothetical protein
VCLDTLFYLCVLLFVCFYLCVKTRKTTSSWVCVFVCERDLIDNQEVTEGRSAQRPVGSHRLWVHGFQHMAASTISESPDRVCERARERERETETQRERSDERDVSMHISL